MRNVSTLAGLTLVALTATARAQGTPSAAAAAAPAAVDAGAVQAPAPAAASDRSGRRRLQLGVSFLPMAGGKLTASMAGTSSTSDLVGAFGLGVSASYVLRPGLTVGFAPQAILKLTPKDTGTSTADQTLKQYDLMARIAYTHPLADALAVFAEVLPGYSILMGANNDAATGFVVAFGAGLAMDLGQRTFASLGAGYQLGFQQRSSGGAESGDVKTRFVRVALGVGMRM